MGNFKNILYVIGEGGDEAEGVARAVDVTERNEAVLTILEVSSLRGSAAPGTSPGDNVLALEKMVAGFQDRLEIQIKVLNGRPFLEAIRAVLRDRYDLMMKVAENSGFLNRLFGSTDMHLLRKCPCPLWLMKLPADAGLEHVVAAVDYDPYEPQATDQELNRVILELAGATAVSGGASLHVVHAWEAYAESSMRVGNVQAERIAKHVQTQHSRHESALFAIGRSLEEHLGKEGYARVSPRFHLLKGSPRIVIPQLVDELRADLLVMGTVARAGLPGLIIGNTAETILNQLSCSVLAVKPPGFRTPVTLDS